jgi:CRISPR-associated protein Cas5d
MEYSVKLEISGPTAMWTRPDTGDAPVSYPAPTYGAVKGIFESILYSEWAEVVPTKVEICKPIVYHTYTTNYGGPLRKSKNMIKGASYQLLATVLINVCYRLYADIQSDKNGYRKHGRQGLQETGTTNGSHAYQEMFNRRLARGQFYHIPCMGWNEFTPDYVGSFREGTNIIEDTIPIPSMLITCHPDGRSSHWNPKYKQNILIEKGVLTYDK